MTIEKLEKNTNTALIVYKSVEPVDKSVTKKGGTWGGRRPGSGQRKGKKQKRTIEKLAVKREFEDRVAQQAHRLLSAQLSVALGTQYLFMRFKVKTAKGWRWSKFERVEDPGVMLRYLEGELKSSDEEYYMLTAEKPDVGTIDSLLDRAFGRAPQNLNIKDDRPDPIAAILAQFGLLEEEGNSNDHKTPSTTETSS
jgi:hypothetical protein